MEVKLAGAGLSGFCFSLASLSFAEGMTQADKNAYKNNKCVTCHGKIDVVESHIDMALKATSGAYKDSKEIKDTKPLPKKPKKGNKIFEKTHTEFRTTSM